MYWHLPSETEDRAAVVVLLGQMAGAVSFLQSSSQNPGEAPPPPTIPDVSLEEQPPSMSPTLMDPPPQHQCQQQRPSSSKLGELQDLPVSGKFWNLIRPLLGVGVGAVLGYFCALSSSPPPSPTIVIPSSLTVPQKLGGAVGRSGPTREDVALAPSTNTWSSLPQEERDTTSSTPSSWAGEGHDVLVADAPPRSSSSSSVVASPDSTATRSTPGAGAGVDPDDYPGDNIFKTWCDTVTTNIPIRYPKTDGDLQNILAEAKQLGKKVRVVGAKHSSGGLVTDGEVDGGQKGIILLSLYEYAPPVGSGWEAIAVRALDREVDHVGNDNERGTVVEERRAAEVGGL